jgi:hypothetical protein
LFALFNRGFAAIVAWYGGAIERLMAWRYLVFALIAAARERPELQRVTTTFTPATEQIATRFNRDLVKALDIDLNEAFGTLQAYLGGRYVNDFILGRDQYRVYIQVAASQRSQPDDIGAFFVRSCSCALVPLRSVLSSDPFLDPPHNHRPQCVRIREDPVLSGAGLQQRPGDRGDGGAGRHHPRPRLRLRMVGLGAGGEKCRWGHHGDLRPGLRAGVPGDGRPVRQLHRSADHPAHRAAGHHMGDGGDLAAGESAAGQRLLAGDQQ